MRNRTSSVKAQRWQQIIQQWQQSGMSQAEFCRLHQLNVNTFTWWKTSLLGRGKAQAKQKPRQGKEKFVPVVVTSGSEESRDPPSRTPVRTAPWGMVAAEISNQEGSSRVQIFDGTSPETIAAIIGACFK